MAIARLLSSGPPGQVDDLVEPARPPLALSSHHSSLTGCSGPDDEEGDESSDQQSSSGLLVVRPEGPAPAATNSNPASVRPVTRVRSPVADQGQLGQRCPSITTIADGQPSTAPANHDVSWWPSFLRSAHSAAHTTPNPHGGLPQFEEPLPSDLLATRSPERSFDPDPNFVPFPDDPVCLRHSEYGFDPLRSSSAPPSNNQPNQPNQPDLDLDQEPKHIYQQTELVERYLWSSQCDHPLKHSQQADHEQIENAGYWTYLSTYWSYLLVVFLGHVCDAFGRRFYPAHYAHLMPHNGYAALNSDFGSFFSRRVKSRLDDTFNRPVTGSPARTIKLLNRTSSDNCQTFRYTHQITQALNISSYNYLGFSQSRGVITDAVQHTINSLGLAAGGSRDDTGTMSIHIQTEKLLANFVGCQDSILISQGFATNSTTFPSLISKGSLVISDELNHASIRFGTRLTGAHVRTFKHNDMVDLERILRESISQGQPRKLRQWKRIFVVVEGIYSMEGSIVDLPNLIRLKAKYQFYLYVDEAHSIGALGPRGRGVCDYYGIDPNQIDILMGTLTKSFGASGGYVAGKKTTIDHLRKTCHSTIYAESPSPAILSQIISSIISISGSDAIKSPIPVVIPSQVLDQQIDEGRVRLQRLAFNARYLRAGLRKLGFIVVGDTDSPIVPLLVFQPGKLLIFSRMMLEKYSIVVVIVGYPATPLVLGRVRFCVSSAHTKEDIDKILIGTDEIGGMLGLKLNTSQIRERLSIDEIIKQSRRLVLEA